MGAPTAVYLGDLLESARTRAGRAGLSEYLRRLIAADLAMPSPTTSPSQQCEDQPEWLHATIQAITIAFSRQPPGKAILGTKLDNILYSSVWSTIDYRGQRRDRFRHLVEAGYLLVTDAPGTVMSFDTCGFFNVPGMRGGPALAYDTGDGPRLIYFLEGDGLPSRLSKEPLRQAEEATTIDLAAEAEAAMAIMDAPPASVVEAEEAPAAAWGNTRACRCCGHLVGGDTTHDEVSCIAAFRAQRAGTSNA